VTWNRPGCSWVEIDLDGEDTLAGAVTVTIADLAHTSAPAGMRDDPSGSTAAWTESASRMRRRLAGDQAAGPRAAGVPRIVW